MPFGDSMQRQAENSGEVRTYISQWLDPQRGANRTGRRVFRILPIVGEDGTLVMPDEVRFAEFWIPVMQNAKVRQQRVMVNPDNPFKNPVWERLYADMPKEKAGKPNPDRKLPRQKFALNVLDMTKVIELPSKQFAYPSDDSKYYTVEDGKKVKLDGTPTVLNQVRILEGSAGKAGGKHMLQMLADLSGSVSDPNDEERILELYEFDIVLKISGEGTDTRRSFNLGGNFKALSGEQLAMPRYDLTSWAAPWPNDVLNALLDGEDFDSVMEGANITLFPKLDTDEEDSEEEAPF
jgi:hypothetical protein